MKSIRLLLILFIALATLAMQPGAASAQIFSGYVTGVNIQNLGADTAILTITFYNAGTTDGAGGTVANTVSDSITGFSVKNYFPLNVTTGFHGSIVVSSSQPVAAVTNVSNTTLTALGAYNGMDAGSTTVYLPILHKENNGFSSWYSIQNAGSVPAEVDIDYSSTGPGVDSTVIIKENASVTLYQKNETVHGTVKLFAATLTSDQPLVVVALQENVNNIMAYTGFPTGSLMPVMPIINMNNSGYITGTQIYNLETFPTTVTVSYSAGTYGSNCTETREVPGKTMVSFTWDAFTKTVAGETCVDGQRFLGSGRVTANTANAQLAVVVNQLKTPLYTNGSSYSGFDASTANNTVFMPTIFDRNSGWFTAFNLMNVGTETTYVQCTYANSTVTSNTGAAGLAPGSSVTISQIYLLGDKYIGSAVCKAYNSTDYVAANLDTDAKIVTVVNELGAGSPDNLLSYEGINPK